MKTINKKWLVKVLLVVTLFVFARSFIDYAVCMWGLEIIGSHWDYYAQFLLWSGLFVPLFLWTWKPQYILLGGIGVFLAENFFYVWVSLLGNLNGCYDWYSGNPLNPDGVFGYGWTNPMNMIQFFGHVMYYFVVAVIIIFVIGKGIQRLRRRY